MYVDDWQWVCLTSLLFLPASLALLLLVGLVVPFRWKKLLFGRRLLLLGLALDLGVPAWLIPTTKPSRAVLLLSTVEHLLRNNSGPTVRREEMERGTGLPL